MGENVVSGGENNPNGDGEKSTFVDPAWDQNVVCQLSQTILCRSQKLERSRKIIRLTVMIWRTSTSS